MSTKDQIKIDTYFSKGQYATQVETLEIDSSKRAFSIGVPKESDENEYRIAVVPQSIRTLVGYGHRVIVEADAGKSSSYHNDDFDRAGAYISRNKKEVFQADIVIKLSPPTIDELDYCHEGQIIICALSTPTVSKAFLEKIVEKKLIAFDIGQLKKEDGSYPFVRIMGEMAGRIAIVTAAELLEAQSGGRGVLLGGVSGVPPAKVLILGAGIVGEYATRTALALGASVRIFDNDITKITILQNKIGRTLHTSSINPEYLANQLTSADVVISAIHSKRGRAPIIITSAMVDQMKEGAVIIDVSIDQGGCVETSRLTTHKNPTFVEHGVIHYCVSNIAAKVPHTSSAAISNIMTTLLLRLTAPGTLTNLLYQNEGIRHGLFGYCGFITKEYLARRFDMKYTALELVLTSGKS